MNAQPQQVDIENFSAFLKEAGWGHAEVVAISGDAGLRRYFRLTKDNQTALLMDMSRSGYEASLDAFVTIGSYLKENNVLVPEIKSISLDSGLAIIADFGDTSFGDILRSGQKETTEQEKLYQMATDVLINLREISKNNDLHLGHYNQSRIRERLIQFVDHYKPAVTGVETTDKDRQDFQDVWARIEKSLPSCPLGFCHADYHLENLMWRPDVEQGYGLIDFQDAFWGFQGYDLLNLLEDARVSVPHHIKKTMKDRYCAGMGVSQHAVFDDWYSVLCAHFHCRVIGLFVKLYVERGMDQYLEHIPRLQCYITENLKNPVLAPLKEFIDRHNIALDKSPV